MTTELVPWKQALADSRDKFEELVDYNGLKMAYSQEAMFAMQALQKNSYVLKAANDNAQSLRNAVINIAALGLSLNPATSYAYLVPRDGAICLDISYKGLIKLATDTGCIKWAQADLVYESDTFEYNGPAEKPVHKTNPFKKDRGEVVGVYCIAKTVDNDILVEVMDREELDKVKNASKAKTGPWQVWPGEMMKKTVIKRASKTWPRSSGNERLETAVHVLNEHEGIESNVSTEHFEDFTRLIEEGDFMGLYAFKQNLELEQYTELHKARLAEAPKGKKTVWRQEVDGMIQQAEARIMDYTTSIFDATQNNDESQIAEILEEIDDIEYSLIFNRLNPAEQLFMEGVKEAA